MTEREWLECTDPQRMVQFLTKGAGSDRQLRLFGWACCRQMWDLLIEDCFRHAVEVAERFADGQATSEELAVAKKESGEALERIGTAGATASRYCAIGSAWSCTRNPQTAAMYPLWVFNETVQRKKEVLLLRDIFGNSFRPVVLSPSSFSWNDFIISKLAQTIYDERAFDRLPILADALEEAGCTNYDILNHCRLPGEHVRGCWVIDLILGKK